MGDRLVILKAGSPEVLALAYIRELNTSGGATLLVLADNDLGEEPKAELVETSYNRPASLSLKYLYKTLIRSDGRDVYVYNVIKTEPDGLQGVFYDTPRRCRSEKEEAEWKALRNKFIGGKYLSPSQWRRFKILMGLHPYTPPPKYKTHHW